MCVCVCLWGVCVFVRCVFVRCVCVCEVCVCLWGVCVFVRCVCLWGVCVFVRCVYLWGVWALDACWAHTCCYSSAYFCLVVASLPPHVGYCMNVNLLTPTQPVDPHPACWPPPRLGFVASFAWQLCFNYNFFFKNSLFKMFTSVEWKYNLV